MRGMRAVLVGLAIAIGILGFSASTAQAFSVTVTVRGPDGKPVKGADVSVGVFDGTGVTRGQTGDDGTVTIDLGNSAGSDVYRVRVSGGGDLEGSTTVHLGGDRKAPVTVGTKSLSELPPSARIDPASVEELAKRAREAAEKCDKSGYDSNVNQIRQKIAEEERQLSETQQAADDFARDNGVRITDLQGARADRARAEKAQKKLPENLRNPDALKKLDRYITLLQAIESLRAIVEADRAALKGIPPFPDTCPDDKHGMAPSGDCPEGKFAGGLGGLLGLPVACDDPSQRRETEREREKDRKD
jgi:hypothetical protein